MSAKIDMFENGIKKRVIFPPLAQIVQKGEGKYRDHLIFKKFCSVFYRSALVRSGAYHSKNNEERHVITRPKPWAQDVN